MPTARAGDGVELHWEERGSGPPVIFVSYWSLDPRVWDPVAAELESDHRLIRYDDRGTGRSDRTGPYDIETSADDLEAIAEAAGGGPAVAIAMVDGTNRAVRVAARRPDLISDVIGMGGAPLSRDVFADSESLISSSTVVGAFMQQLEADYRGALRALMEASNPQMSQDELRDRVAQQVEHVPREAAAPRIQAWAEDNAGEQPAKELGDRLTLLLGGTAGGGWFPPDEVMRKILAEHFPQARIVEVEDGILSRPDQAASVVRELTARAAADVEPAT